MGRAAADRCERVEWGIGWRSRARRRGQCKTGLKHDAWFDCAMDLNNLQCAATLTDCSLAERTTCPDVLSLDGTELVFAADIAASLCVWFDEGGRG